MDVLALLNTEEDNLRMVEHMAGELAALVVEFPEGKMDRLEALRSEYEGLRGEGIKAQKVGHEEQ